VQLHVGVVPVDDPLVLDPVPPHRIVGTALLSGSMAYFVEKPANGHDFCVMAPDTQTVGNR
jgi:hypothetical protein